MTTLPLHGKAGLVTGAGRGIGAALAQELARQGAAVVVNDVGAALDGSPTAERPADEVVAAIRAAGGQAVASYDTVCTSAGARAMVDACRDAFGRFDFAVHNAGVARDRIFHKMTDADWDDVIGVHLTGGFHVFRAAAEVFRGQGAGALVAMTSTSGLVGSVGQASYAAAKLGLVALVRSVALDMQRYGVRANAVAPFAWTRMTASIPEADDPVTRKRLEALKQLRPEDVAPLVAFLVSDASQAVNGQVFAQRGAEIVLFGLPRPVRSLHRAGGWTVDGLAEVLPAALARDFEVLRTTGEVFGYPVLG